MKEMQFEIMPERKAAKYLDHESYIVVGYRSFGYGYANFQEDHNRIATLVLTVEDMTKQMGNMILFNAHHANILLEFVYANTLSDYRDNKRINKIVCFCAAGISRSSATCAALMDIYNGHGSSGVIYSDNRYHPNGLIYHTIMAEYETNWRQKFFAKGIIKD